MAKASESTHDLRIAGGEERHVQKYLRSWVPYYLAKATFDTAWTYQLFPWEKILIHPLYDPFVAVDKAEGIEGMIAFEKASKAPTALTVSFLASAPWNYGEGRLRHHVGTGLIGFAIQHSILDGRGGALLLSSTREAETFYERLQFERTGAVDREGLSIFRLSSQRATAFLRIYSPLK